jgi:hypothetical protein
MPLTEIVPDVGFSKSAMTRSKVVLPQPDGPMKETNSPLPMVRSTLESASTGPSLVWKVRPSLLAETTAGEVPVIGRSLPFAAAAAQDETPLHLR